MPNETDEKHYTAPEVADRLRLHVETVRRWIKDGRIDAKTKPGRSGKEYLIPASELDRLLEDVEVS